MIKKRPTPTSAGGKRRALQRNQITSLILHGSLTTTETRAKQLKPEVERLISRAKGMDLNARRRILAFLPNKAAAKKLFDLIIPQFSARGAAPAGGQGPAPGGGGRAGGFVRVVKLPPRRGDGALMARVEFVEEIAEVTEEGETKRGKTRKEAGKKSGKEAKVKGDKKRVRRDSASKSA